MNGPKVKLMELREYRSERTGNTYFSGFLGKAKVVILRDDRAECTGKEVARWNMLLEEPEPRADDRAPRGNGRDRGHRSDCQNSARGRIPAGASPPRETAADRRACEVMREQGIDADREMPRDEVPF